MGRETAEVNVTANEANCEGTTVGTATRPVVSRRQEEGGRGWLGQENDSA